MSRRFPLIVALFGFPSSLPFFVRVTALRLWRTSWWTVRLKSSFWFPLSHSLTATVDSYLRINSPQAG